MPTPFARSVLGLMACAALATPAWSANSYFTGVSVQDFDNVCGSGGGVGGRVATPTSSSFACGAARSGAVSSQGHVGVDMHVSGNGQVGGSAEFTTFVTFLPKNGQDDTFIPMQFNTAFAGSMAIGGSADTGYDAVIDIESLDFVRSTSIVTGGPHPSHGDLTLGFSEGGEVDNDLSVFIAGVLTTPVVMVRVGTPVSITLTLGANGFGNPGSLNDLLGGSLDFVTGRDLFTLPDGFTAEDPDAFVFDNRFTPPGGVPEPASWALMISGFGMAGGLLRRRRFQTARL